LRAVERTHSTVFDDSVDGSLNFGTAVTRSGDFTLTEGAAIGGRQELNAAVRIRLDATEVFALSTNDQAHKAGLDLDGFRVVVSSQG
jgi:hypothetical protein